MGYIMTWFEIEVNKFDELFNLFFIGYNYLMNKPTRINIFKVENFEFPYFYKFPGQASDEEILFVTRESGALTYFRKAVILLISLIFLIGGLFLSSVAESYLSDFPFMSVNAAVWLVSAMILVIGWWWEHTTWKKSMVFVTTKRLTKIIYTTPFNRHNLSLPLEMIVDTGSYSKGFLQAVLGLGTFTARSSASSSGVATDDTTRINKKYFYIENVSHVEDLQHYISKVLSAFRKDSDRLSNFRPFIPHLKGENRKEFMRRFPDYWS
jgi:protein-S-isoprenylcysteine O-methyltransferase Ste14